MTPLEYKGWNVQQAEIPPSRPSTPINARICSVCNFSMPKPYITILHARTYKYLCSDVCYRKFFHIDGQVRR